MKLNARPPLLAAASIAFVFALALPTAALARLFRNPKLPNHVLLEKYLPPVADQGESSSCVGWATAYYCFSYAVNKARKSTSIEVKNPHYQFSPAFIWHQFNGGDGSRGMTISEAFDMLRTQGCATMDEMRWDGKDFTSQPSAAVKASARRFMPSQTVNLMAQSKKADPEVFKAWLAERRVPFVIGVRVFQDFQAAPHDPDYVYKNPADNDSSNSVVGGTALTVIGYDNANRAFRIVNSWGTSWGDKGKLWLSEDYVAQRTSEAWGVVPRRL